MNFGVSVGDIIAVVGLVERVAKEVRSYKDAPSRFQNLAAELDLLQSAFRNVMQLQPFHIADIGHVDHIRALVIHCQQPLQQFIDKMHLQESSLGHKRLGPSFTAFRTRLHWSLIEQSDIEDLRQVVLSHIAAVNMMLGMYQLWERSFPASESRLTICLGPTSNELRSWTWNPSTRDSFSSKVVQTPTQLRQQRYFQSCRIHLKS